MKSESDAKGTFEQARLWDGARGPLEIAQRKAFSRSRSNTDRVVTIHVSCRVPAPPKRVFDAWLDPKIAARWLFATATRPMTQVEIDARVGGVFRFVERRAQEMFEYRGEYVELLPHRRLAFTLSFASDPQMVTWVKVEIDALGRGSYLKLTHQNLPENYATYFEQRWTGVLYGLGLTLDVSFDTFNHHQE